MLFDVRTTNGVDEATTVPSSGIHTWKSEGFRGGGLRFYFDPIDLVDEEDDRLRRSDRLQQRTGQEELFGKDVFLQLVPFLVRVGLDSKELLFVVPLVERLASSRPS